MRIILIFLILILTSCGIDQSQIKEELDQEISLFDKNISQYDLVFDELKKHDLLTALKPLDTLGRSKYPSYLLKLADDLTIQKIKYGRVWTCEANGDYSRELFFERNDSVDVWFCPCIRQSEQDHFHDNKGLRGYKGHDNFYSIGRGGNWAMVKRH